MDFFVEILENTMLVCTSCMWVFLRFFVSNTFYLKKMFNALHALLLLILELGVFNIGAPVLSFNQILTARSLKDLYFWRDPGDPTPQNKAQTPSKTRVNLGSRYIYIYCRYIYCI